MAASSGRLQYLTLVGYKDKTFKSKIGAYRALINPDKYSQRYEIKFDDEQGIGTSNATLKYKRTTPPGLDFELIFDGTGVLSTSRTDVLSDINNFKKVVYTYNGDIHKPNYIKLIWGKGLSFQCQLTSLSFNYTLFKTDGSPLRARATASFKEYQNPNQVAAHADDESPDMTHEHVVIAGDTLPGLTQKMYGSSTHYLQVASYNKLENFRQLVPGTKLLFPPLI
ncbi:MAG: CIS tube protein [Bacteroidota bacterium]